MIWPCGENCCDVHGEILRQLVMNFVFYGAAKIVNKNTNGSGVRFHCPVDSSFTIPVMQEVFCWARD